MLMAQHLCMQNAFKCYLRTRDYCTTSKHILSMCLNVVRVSFAMSNYLNVTNYVQKAEATPDSTVSTLHSETCIGCPAAVCVIQCVLPSRSTCRMSLFGAACCVLQHDA